MKKTSPTKKPAIAFDRHVSKRADKWTQRQWNKKVLQMCESNHIWLNAFHCINPTPKFCEQLGRSIIEKLKDKENLIPSSLITSDAEPAREIAKLTPILYMSINKS